MENRILDRITIYVAALALPMVAIALALGGLPSAIGAVAGAALAFGNWQAMRFLIRLLKRANERAKSILMILLVAKMGLVLGLAALLMRVFDPLGVLLGLGALVMGILGGTIHAQIAGAITNDDGITNNDGESVAAATGAESDG